MCNVELSKEIDEGKAVNVVDMEKILHGSLRHTGFIIGLLNGTG